MKAGRNNQKKLVFYLIWVLFIFTGIASADDGKAESGDTTIILMKLLKAVEDYDYDNFVADGSAVFKAGITKQMFEGVCAQLSPRMKKGYDKTYLGRLNQQGCQVYLWKLQFKDGGDDILAKLVLKDGGVAGFWLQ